MPRLRQAVMAVTDLERSVRFMRSELGLGEPFADPAIQYFGLQNAVFAIGDTFLELVSPIQDDTAAGRLIEKYDGACGYMAMLQVEDIAAARDRARKLGIREVFEVEFEDIAEVHLHPADIGGAIVSLSEPKPTPSWRWGGPDWPERSTTGGLVSVTVAVADAETIGKRWQEVAGGTIPANFVADPASPGIIEIDIELDGHSIKVTPGDLV
ncbi:MAG: VOC family protein [Solirubrobacterales bacterium]|nr:VOC family protein [Solirubrobacterales bacterium]